MGTKRTGKVFLAGAIGIMALNAHFCLAADAGPVTAFPPKDFWCGQAEPDIPGIHRAVIDVAITRTGSIKWNGRAITDQDLQNYLKEFQKIGPKDQPIFSIAPEPDTPYAVFAGVVYRFQSRHGMKYILCHVPASAEGASP